MSINKGFLKIANPLSSSSNSDKETVRKLEYLQQKRIAIYEI
jgi:hypothetical protein